MPKKREQKVKREMLDHPTTTCNRCTMTFYIGRPSGHSARSEVSRCGTPGCGREFHSSNVIRLVNGIEDSFVRVWVDK